MEEAASTRLCGGTRAMTLAGIGRQPQISLKSSLFQRISGKAGFAGSPALPIRRARQLPSSSFIRSVPGAQAGFGPAIGSGAQVAQAEDARRPERSAAGGWACAANAAGGTQVQILPPLPIRRARQLPSSSLIRSVPGAQAGFGPAIGSGAQVPVPRVRCTTAAQLF